MSDNRDQVMVTSQPADRRSNPVETTAIVCMAVTFLALLAVVDLLAPTPADRWVLTRIQDIPWGELRFIPVAGSEIGGGGVGFFLVPGLTAAILALSRRWSLLILLAAVFALHYIAISPKLLIPAHRPSPLFGVEGGGGLESFPSGHVQWAVLFYGSLAFLAWRNLRPPWRRLILPVYVAIVVGAMLGRMELGKHWPVDTIGGVLAGLLALRVLIALHDWLRPTAGGAGGGLELDKSYDHNQQRQQEQGAVKAVASALKNR